MEKFQLANKCNKEEKMDYSLSCSAIVAATNCKSYDKIVLKV